MAAGSLQADGVMFTIAQITTDEHADAVQFSIISTASAWAQPESTGAVTSALAISRSRGSDSACVLRLSPSSTAPRGAQLLGERKRQRLFKGERLSLERSVVGSKQHRNVRIIQ